MTLKLVVGNIQITKTKDGEVPEWFLLFQEGKNELADGLTYLVDKKAFDLVYAEFQRRGIDVVFDYEHQTLHDIEAPASGWVKDYKYESGIWGKIVWTEKAKNYILSDEYRYFSPVFYIAENDANRLCTVHSFALTNSPRHNNLKPLLAKLVAKKETNIMTKEELLKLLNIAEDAKDEDIKAIVAKLQEDTKKDEKIVTKEVVAKEILEALELKEDAETSEVVATIHAAKQSQKQGVSVEEFKKLQDKIAETESKEIVSKALTAGKITPDQKEWAEDYAKRDAKGFETFITKAPVVVPVSKLPGGEIKAKQAEYDDATKQIAKMMGISQEDIKKYGKEAE